MKVADQLFRGPCDFRFGVTRDDGFPLPGGPEFALIGRSNVGKSSLLNALVDRPIARVSHTPGRTQQINFFALGDKLWLVDLPGYGHAAVAKSARRSWQRLSHAYLRGRRTLRRVLLLVDGRHGPKDNDLTMMEMLDEAGVGYHLVLTKVDDTKTAQFSAGQQAAASAIARRAAAAPEILATSAHQGTGIPELRALLYGLAA